VTVRRLAHPVLILAAALALLPFLMRSLGLTTALATELALMAMAGLGFNLLLGYTGLVSFGHGAFFGLASYGAALLQIHVTNGGVIVPVLFGTAFAALLGLVIGFLILRRRGVYFSLLTLAFTAMVFYIVFRSTGFTGGESGLGGIKRATLLGLDLDDQTTLYVVVCLIVLGVSGLMWRLVNSPFGRVLLAIRENQQRAEFVGFPVQRYKLVAFIVSATVVGLAGTLFALLKYFISADLVHVTFSGEILAMSVIGGQRSFLGPAVGALFFILFRELLTGITAGWQLWFGLLFMGFVLFSPNGLMGLGERILAPLRKDRREAAAMAKRVTPDPGAEIPAFLRGRGDGSGQVLAVDNISKRFGAFVAVDKVHLALAPRGIHALIGPNGAGKTTLFNVLSGMFPPDGGTIAYQGRSIAGQPAAALAGLGIARSFQITNIFKTLTVAENLRLAAQARDPRRFAFFRHSDTLAQVNAQTDALIQFLGLKGLEEVNADSLSYGGQRLLEIGLALAVRPRVLLLDEPLVGLAAGERERIVGLIQRLSEHMSVLVIEHDIDRVFAFAGSITVMHNGAVLATGAPAEVRAHAQVQAVYLGTGRRVSAPRKTPGTTAKAEPLLRLEAVNAFYGASHILHDVSLELHAGEMVALLGRNGAGKSSTLKAITGINPPRSGRVLYLGQDITGWSPEDVARAGIGLVPQGRRLFPTLTIAQNLEMGRLKRIGREGVRWPQERVFQTFPRIKERLDAKADTLSGGEQQMVAIARALVGSTRLLLMDEPFEGLSPAMCEEVFKVIDALRCEIPILMIEHDLDLALALTDRIYVLDRGRIGHEGPAEPLHTDLELRKATLWL
jgi:ABC-type branched-subunit amino acid transport system ATPase component/ABC-type branched-subunit amino acid transport system permease subunit